MNGIRNRTWATINLDNVKYNYEQIRNATKAKVCCVVKANAYGHGAIMLAKTFQDLGAEFLSVSNIEEALQLRENGITLPILILGYTPTDCAEILAKNNISQTVYSPLYAKALSKCANESGVKINVHIKLDTGMGRIGFLTDQDSLNELAEICSDKAFIMQGVYTHFALADEGIAGVDYTKTQCDKFTFAINYLHKRDINFEIKHCSNSASIFDYNTCHFDMVRAGIVLYGYNPSNKLLNMPKLKKAMQVYSVISHIKTIEKGQSVSYGRTFIADKKMKIATVPIGYADGFLRYNGNMRYSLKVNGKYAPILGRVCMDQTMIDVTDIDCNVGDEILIFGEDSLCSADQIAKLNSTINYEISCSVGLRVPRIYIKNQKIIALTDYVYSNDI